MIRIVARIVAITIASLALVHAADSQAGAIQRQPPRSAILLDDDWQLYTMPDFDAWPAEQQLTAEQIRQLKIPGSHAGWRSIRLPDDYVVRGEFSQEPNKSLLAGGAVCSLGGRECEKNIISPRCASPM